jgi:hypothetical protein
MRRALLGLLLTGCAGRWDVTRPARDGFTAPRIVHQGVRSAAGVGVYAGLRWAGMRPGPAGAWGFTLSGLAPHLVGYARGAYRFNGCDWAADAVIAGGSPVVAALCEQRGRWCRRAVPLYAAGWALAAGCASP